MEWKRVTEKWSKDFEALEDEIYEVLNWRTFFKEDIYIDKRLLFKDKEYFLESFNSGTGEADVMPLTVDEASTYYDLYKDFNQVDSKMEFTKPNNDFELVETSNGRCFVIHPEARLIEEIYKRISLVDISFTQTSVDQLKTDIENADVVISAENTEEETTLELVTKKDKVHSVPLSKEEQNELSEVIEATYIEQDKMPSKRELKAEKEKLKKFIDATKSKIQEALANGSSCPEGYYENFKQKEARYAEVKAMLKARQNSKKKEKGEIEKND